jgi:hypothetical protein
MRLFATTPEEDVRWHTILDREKMEQHLLEYNRKSFRAEAGTPCGHGVIMDTITFTATSQAAAISQTASYLQSGMGTT